MGVVTALLALIPALVSYQMFAHFGEEGETVTVALIQPNLDPYTEKFVPERQAQHLEEFFRIAESICDEETDYLLGPETLIVEQIDERNPSASPYYRQFLDFQTKYPKLNCLVGSTAIKEPGRTSLPGSRFNREEGFFYEAFNTALFLSPVPPQFYHKTKLVPLFERMPFVQYLSFLGKYSWSLGDIWAPTASGRKDRHLYPPNLPLRFCPSSVSSRPLVPTAKPSGSKGLYLHDHQRRMVEKHARLPPPLPFQPRSCHRMPPGSGAGGQYRDLSPHRRKRHGDGEHALVGKGHTERANPSAWRSHFFCPARGLLGRYFHVVGGASHCVCGNWKRHFTTKDTKQEMTFPFCFLISPSCFCMLFVVNSALIPAWKGFHHAS